MLIWLPLFSTNALAVSVSMSVPAGHCQDESMQISGMAMDNMDRQANDQPACDSCTLCHLACTAAVPGVLLAVQNAVREVTPDAVYFYSFTSAPLLPPPLARV